MSAIIFKDKQPIGSCIIVLDKSKTKVLLGQRKNSYKAGYFGLPGGRIELKEAARAAAQRELFEETNLVADSLDYLGVIRDHQQTYDFIHFVYLVKTYSGQIENREPNKCNGWQWHSLLDLPEQILRGHKLALELYGSQQGFIDAYQD